MTRPLGATGRSTSSLGRKAKALHRSAILVDAQGVCVLLPCVHLPPPDYNGVSFLKRAQKAGLTAMNTTMGLAPIVSGEDNLRGLLASIYGNLEYIEIHSKRLMLIEEADDIRQAKRLGKVGVIFGVQGIYSKIEGDLTLLKILRRLGLRVATITLNDRNPIGSGCMEEVDAGLTQFGRACVREMGRVGMLVDLAHAGERTALDAIEVSEKPCIVSHANVKSLSDHPRNVSDTVLKALAKRGGAIGITAYAPFIRERRKGHPTIKDVVAHVRYVADLVGVDHVAIGTDHFDAESDVRFREFSTRFPNSQRGYSRATVNALKFERVDDWPRLTEELLRSGFTEAETKKVLGENCIRIFRSGWKVQ